MPRPPAVIWIRLVAGAIDNAGTEDCNVGSTFGRNQRFIWLIHPIDIRSNVATVGVSGLQGHALVNIQVDMTLQRERSGNIDGVFAGHAELHDSAALRRTGIDRILNGGGIVRRSIPDGPEAGRIAGRWRGAPAAATTTTTARRERHG